MFDKGLTEEAAAHLEQLLSERLNGSMSQADFKEALKSIELSEGGSVNPLDYVRVTLEQ